MKNSVIISLIFVLATVLFAEKVNDQNEGKVYYVSDSKSVPNLIDYQGRITDSSNNPITTPVSIVFVIYDAEIDGTQLWTETHPTVTPVEGLVHVQLSGFASDLFDGSDLWLGINVNSDGEMEPRLRIVSVPYAIHAETAETDNDWTIMGDDLYTDNPGSVGIGTTTPNTNTKLHVYDGTILFDGTSGSTPVSGAGTRFMWIPSKSAFRAGYVNGTQWDDVNIGSYSVAFGNNNTTSGAYSFAAGSGNSITGIASSAFGLSNNVTRPYSYAFGNNSSATGSYSFAFGRYSEAQALHSIALGRFNVVSGTWGTWIDSEPLFILGNGADDLNRSNALTVFKDGRTTIGSDTRGEMLTVEGTVESTMGGFKFPDGSTQTSAATGGGDITSVTAGIGLTGGGVTGDVTLNVDMAGSGSATTVSHSDHEHGINDLTDGKTGGYSVFLGYNAGFNDNGSLGNDNVGTGHAALYNNITGSNNAAFGYHALMANTSGQYNIGIGSLSNLYNQEGSQNTIIGHLAGSGGILHNKSGNVFIGFSAGFFEYSNNKLYIENTTSSSPLIYGDFTDGSEIVKINGDFQVTGELRDSDNQPGTNGQMLSSNGTGTDWVDIISVTTHYIGESYGGGIVFYVYDEGKHGLIVDTSGESTGEWYNGTYRYTGTTGDGLYAGTMNTAMIVATQMADNQTGNFVAKVCADYSVTDGGVTYGDWYLPSKYELNLLYLQKDVVGGLQGGGYWSSTEISSDSAWFQWFFSGEQDEDTKNTVGYVRAIRAF